MKVCNIANPKILQYRQTKMNCKFKKCVQIETIICNANLTCLMFILIFDGGPGGGDRGVHEVGVP